MTPPLDPLPGNRCPSAEQYEALAQHCEGALREDTPDWDDCDKCKALAPALRAAASLASDYRDLVELNGRYEQARDLRYEYNRQLGVIADLRRERDAAKEKVRAIVTHPIFKFLLGEGELDGLWFGDTKEFRRFHKPYWWRHNLSELLAATADKEAQP